MDQDRFAGVGIVDIVELVAAVDVIVSATAFEMLLVADAADERVVVVRPAHAVDSHERVVPAEAVARRVALDRVAAAEVVGRLAQVDDHSGDGALVARDGAAEVVAADDGVASAETLEDLSGISADAVG